MLRLGARFPARRSLHLRRFMSSSSTSTSTFFQTLSIKKEGHIGHIQLARPNKRNAMNSVFWKECRQAFDEIGEDGDVRVIIISGQGKAFSAGLDLTDIGIDLIGGSGDEDVARKAFRIKKHVTTMQEAFNAIEGVPQPVIAAIHGACIGGAIDLISACDIRYCSADAVFSIKEVAIGLAADLGTLQRLPKIVSNDSMTRELAYTGRNFTAQEALTLGLISKISPPSAQAVVQAATELAKEIVTKSPVAVYGTKANLNYSRDHTIKDGLDYMTTWNASALQTEDLAKSVEAHLTKQPPTFSKL